VTAPGLTKTCTKCRLDKPRAEFSKHAVAKGGVTSRCKPCAATAARARNAANPERLAVINRRSKLKRAFGISLEQYDAMLAAQGGRCGICGTGEPTGKRGILGPVFHVDHCHKTGKIRGLLCASCNPALGAFGDSAERLAAAIAYLERGPQ
jgi:hypothetical protein